MTDSQRTPRVHVVPLITGASLWVAATALLLEDAYRTNHFDVQHLAVPILTSATVVAGIMAHHALARLKLVSGLALVLLAVLGSALCLLNTLSRTAADRDRAQASATAGNRTFSLKRDALDDARRMTVIECGKRGPRCKEWESRVDALTSELAGMTVLSIDPRADAVARLATLFGFDGNKAKAIVQALEPAMLPTFLEFGAIVLLGIAFPHRKRAMVAKVETIADHCTVQASQPFTREQALHDVRTLRQAGSGRYLAQRWGVDPSTASRWLQSFEALGAIDRNRAGKAKAVLALPSPRR